MDMWRLMACHLVKNGPKFVRLPVRMTPFFIKKQVIEQMLIWQFQQALTEGELEFLQGKWLKITIIDLDFHWFITNQNERLVVQEWAIPDVSFSAEINDLILVATHKQDSDTLFFQRRLTIEGDTELGLYVKNLIDAMELELMPRVLQKVLLPLAELISANQNEGSGSVTGVSTSC